MVNTNQPWNDPRAIKLSKAQLEEFQTYEPQIKALVSQRERFTQYCVREAGSLEKGPFSLLQGSLVPVDLLPTPVKL